MATKGKDGSLGKEKRGTSPSNSHHMDTTHRRRSPKKSVPASLDKDHATPSDKRVPHYLRPTISSRPDSSNYVKKQVPENTTQKPSLNRRASFNKPPSPSLNRRASFDKPPSPSLIHKALQSPSPRERTNRTSAVSPKPTTTSTKPISGRTSKIHKVVKSQPSLSRPKSIKKTAIKKETNGTTKAPSSPGHIIQTLNIESDPEDKESLIIEVEDELLKVDGEVEFPPEISIPETQESVDIADTDPNNHDDEMLKSFDTSTVSEDQNAPPVDEVEETDEDKVEDEETNDNHHVEEKQNKDESNNNQPEESCAAEPKVEAEVKEGGEGSATDNPQVKTLDEKEEVEEGSQNLKSKEREEAEDVVEEAKPAEAENVALKRQGGQGKKDSPAYNDVIEETASKLLEKRKNKVRALVGAFETVISLQEPEA